MDENNLNHITRLELLDTLKILPSGSPAAKQLATLINSGPLEQANSSDNDVFDIQLGRDTLEAIAYAVEQFAYDQAMPYVVAVEEGNQKPEDTRSFEYWQALSERWSYLELMR